jgi:hypothetical protein
VKASEEEVVKWDPWELVVEAINRMVRNGDVMRSDRLKQVMQEIDPTFSEKDAGFSKYSKFLQEASRRGLLRLTKLENGQYEIVLGTNANVPPEVERELDRPERETPPPPRRRGGRGRPPSTPAAAAEGLPLSEAFDLLRRALTEIGAVGEESTDADQTRERMAELADGDDPLFETRRFQRFLRQAHDADLIDLVKSDDGAYLLRLRPQAPEVEVAGTEPSAGDDERRGRRRRGERGGRSRRGGRRRHGEEEVVPGAEAESVAEPRAPAVRPVPSVAPVAVAPEAAPAVEGKHRNPRFRHGSRGGHAPKSEPRPPAEAPLPEPPVTGPVSHNRSLRGRGGRRGGGPAGQRPPHEEHSPAPRPAPELAAVPTTPTSASASAAPAPRREAPVSPVRSEPRVAPPPAEADAPAAPEESGGLFKRMSAALHRAMLGQPKDEPPSDA